MAESEQVQEATTSRAEELLLEFVRDRDAACPVCGYNVRALTRPVCPECRHELVLTVGATHQPIGWLLVAVAPGFFSGIAAFFTLVPVAGQYLGDGRVSSAVIMLVALDLFGWCSALFAIFIGAKPRRFTAQPRARQRWWAIIIWFVHVAALLVFIVLGAVFL